MSVILVIVVLSKNLKLFSMPHFQEERGIRTTTNIKKSRVTKFAFLQGLAELKDFFVVEKRKIAIVPSQP